MTEKKAADFPSAPVFGRSLRGLGVNILVQDVALSLAFLTEVLGLEVIYQDRDFAVISHGEQRWMLHGDHTYHSNPLLSLTSDGAIRGAGVELQIYGVDPDQAAERAAERGYTILQPATDKPHGLREAYLVAPDGYVWVPSVASSEILSES